MTERQINRLKAEAVGKTEAAVDALFDRERYFRIDKFTDGERGYEVVYWAHHGGTFTVLFDWDCVCGAVYYQY